MRLAFSREVRLQQLRIFILHQFPLWRKEIRSGKRKAEEFSGLRCGIYEDLTVFIGGLSRIRMPDAIQADWDARAIRRSLAAQPTAPAENKQKGRL